MGLRLAALVFLLTAAASSLVLGCGDSAAPRDAEGTAATGQSAAPLTADNGFANDKAAFEYFVGKGLTNFQAAGIVGNLDQESGVSPTIAQPGGPGRGIAQWSVGGRWDTGSNDNAVAFAAKQGASVYALQTQLDFIWYELTAFSSYGLGALKASTSVTDATVAFERDFEGCGTCDESTRIAYAESVLAAYGAIAYDAAFVSQSFPLATTALQIPEGQSVSGYIELKNTGTKDWDSSTRLATTQARDRASVFADSKWMSPSRPAAVTGTVAPGGTYKFAFDLKAPAKTGTYAEFFGVVQEGVAWFSDPGQGGPADNLIQVKVEVVAGAPPLPGTAPPGAPGGASDDAGSAAAPGSGGSTPAAPAPEGPLGTASAGSTGGCQVGAPGGSAPASGGVAWLLALALAALSGRVRRPCRAGRSPTPAPSARPSRACA